MEDKNRHGHDCCGDMELEGRVSHRPENITDNLVKRLNRIEGQIRGIKGMIEKDVYCDDVLIQIAAVQSAMRSVSKLLLESHLKTCIVPKIKNDDNDVIEEFLKTIERMIKTG
ncbi:MAG: metal-sensitive transcriptional regulator [Bacillota bacterium]